MLLFCVFAIQSASIINGERPLVVVIPSFNNSTWYKLNLGTVFFQQYSNYRVIYIDDCSTDNTGDLVQQYIKDCGQQHRVTFIHNESNKGALHNLYYAIHSCQDHEIVLTLDGDDWFNNIRVMSIVNDAYKDPLVWMTYGQFQIYPTGQIGQCKPLPAYVVNARCYRNEDWITSHLRTFYAGLFKQIAKEDLFYKGDFFKVTGDLAFMYPLLELADGRLKFIDTILYEYNLNNPLNDCRVRCGQQLYFERIIRRRSRYEPLDENIAYKLFKLERKQ